MNDRISPIRKWLIEPLARDVDANIQRVARADDIAHIAIMPDVHLARDVCVGLVVATRRLIYPAAVGGDIGCGMAAVAFDCNADVLRDERRAYQTMESLYQTVPCMRHQRQRTAADMPRDIAITSLSDPRLEKLRERDGRVEFATLGRGNHFLEFQADDEDRLWLMIHSGSRAMGPAIRDLHLERCATRGNGLQGLDADRSDGAAYLADMTWARAYARASRRGMMDAAAELIHRLFGATLIEQSFIDCDHNHVAREPHFGEDLYVHRKGAAAAAMGEAGIIPGSMGTCSFHTVGRGGAESLCSSSHGAGRVMSRDEARRRISPKSMMQQMRGVWFDPRRTSSLREEAPEAYKNIEEVMRAQRDLTRIVRRLRPVLSYKGT